MFVARDKLAEGVNMSELTYPTLPVESFDTMSDVGDEWDQFMSDLDTSLQNL